MANSGRIAQWTGVPHEIFVVRLFEHPCLEPVDGLPVDGAAKPAKRPQDPRRTVVETLAGSLVLAETLLVIKRPETVLQIGLGAPDDPGDRIQRGHFAEVRVVQRLVPFGV